MPQLLKPIFVAVIVGFVAFGASATSIRGFIQKQNGFRQLLSQNDDGTQVLVNISGVTPQVQNDINKLKNGDYLVARGTLIGGMANIDAIESLGLQAIVGTWATPKYEVYEFQDFTRLNLYIPNDTRSDVVKAGEFQYSIAPDQGSRYQLFLSNSKSVTVGSLQFRKSHLVLNVIDPQTGESSADIVLSPLARHQDSSTLNGL